MDEEPVRESKWVLRGIGALIAGAVLSLLPILPTHGDCRFAYRERMRYSEAPQVSPQQRAAIRAWALSDGCRTCDNTGCVSFVYWLSGKQASEIWGR